MWKIISTIGSLFVTTPTYVARNPIRFNEKDITVSRTGLTLSKSLRSKIVENIESKYHLAQITIPVEKSLIYNAAKTNDPVISATDIEAISDELGSPIEVSKEVTTESVMILIHKAKPTPEDPLATPKKKKKKE
jgi:capsular polysaccharide biosynthesis protein